jgi:hypothetical protein
MAIVCVDSTMWTRLTSASAAIRRGMIVSAASSSADRITADPSGARVPSTGRRPARVTVATIADVTCDFPVPGWPATTVIFPPQCALAKANRLAAV